MANATWLRKANSNRSRDSLWLKLISGASRPRFFRTGVHRIQLPLEPCECETISTRDHRNNSSFDKCRLGRVACPRSMFLLFNVDSEADWAGASHPSQPAFNEAWTISLRLGIDTLDVALHGGAWVHADTAGSGDTASLGSGLRRVPSHLRIESIMITIAATMMIAVRLVFT